MPVTADGLETWSNPTKGRVWVNRLDHRGEVSKKPDMIGPGRTFHITAVERRLNQEMAYSPDLDIFSNGTLTPVRLLGDDPAEAAAFAANPNLMTEGDMRTLVNKPKSKSDAFAERLGEIRNQATLDRLLALAREEDAPLSRVEAIQERINEVRATAQRGTTTAVEPKPDARTAGPARKNAREPASRAVTPG